MAQSAYMAEREEIIPFVLHFHSFSFLYLQLLCSLLHSTLTLSPTTVIISADSLNFLSFSLFFRCSAFSFLFIPLPPASDFPNALYLNSITETRTKCLKIAFINRIFSTRHEITRALLTIPIVIKGSEDFSEKQLYVVDMPVQGTVTPTHPNFVNFEHHTYETKMLFYAKVVGKASFTIEDEGHTHCGLSNDGRTSRRVTNGIDAQAHQYPWMVIIFHDMYRYGTRCGGTLVSRTHMLTAAHCVNPPIDRNDESKGTRINEVDQLKYFQVYLGNHYRISMGDFPGRQLLIDGGILSAPVLEQILLFPHHHEKALLCHTEKMKTIGLEFVSNDFHDLALMFLKKPVILDYFKDIICLPDQLPQGTQYTRAKVAGWGIMKDQQNPKSLQVATIKYIQPPPLECVTDDASYDPFPVEDLTLVYFLEAENDAAQCDGDSGGPTFIKYNEKNYIIGVVSGSVANDTYQKDKPCEPLELKRDVKVKAHLDWIKGHFN